MTKDEATEISKNITFGGYSPYWKVKRVTVGYRVEVTCNDFVTSEGLTRSMILQALHLAGFHFYGGKQISPEEWSAGPSGDPCARSVANHPCQNIHILNEITG